MKKALIIFWIAATLILSSCDNNETANSPVDKNSLPSSAITSDLPSPSASINSQISNSPVSPTPTRASASPSPTRTPSSSAPIDAYQSYMGTWYDTDNAPDILTISKINNNTFKVEVDLYRLTTIYATAKMENGKIKFLGNTSEDNSTEIINGTLEFNENSILVKIDESAFMYISAGATYNFIIKHN